MFKFFRNIRRGLLKENKMGKYLAYATGEIVLVVIGILIALQINNLNEQIKLNVTEKSLLQELKINLQTNVANLKSDIQIQEEGISAMTYLLDHLDQKRPYKDTLDYLFVVADYAPDVVLTSSGFETLKSSGLSIIQNDQLRTEIINLFEKDYPLLMQETRRIEDQVWPSVVVPLYQKHFRREEVKRAYPTNYGALLDDVEFTNMLSFRLNMRKSSSQRKQKAIDQTTRVIAHIDKELN